MGFRFTGIGFRVSKLDFRVYGEWFGVHGLRFRSMVYGLVLRLEGLGLKK